MLKVAGIRSLLDNFEFWKWGGWIQGIIKLLPIYQSEQICFLIYCLFLTKFVNSDFVKECFEPEILRKVFFPVQFESCYSFWGY